MGRESRTKHMSLLGNYKFTNKSHPLKGIMSAVLGMIALVSMFLAIYLTYLDGMDSVNDGTARMQYGLAVLLAFLMAFAGEITGLVANTEKDCYRFFPKLGLLLNSAALFVGVYILCAGI